MEVRMSVFLTRVQRPADKSVNATHKFVVSGFPEGEEYARAGALWRQDGDNLTIQSKTVPLGWHGIEHKTIDITRRLKGAEAWSFRLRSNPVKNVTGGRRLPVQGEAALLDWFEERVRGCEIIDLDFDERGGVRVPERSFTINTVDFKGILKVTDPEEFTEWVASGVGRSKPWGYGMVFGNAVAL